MANEATATGSWRTTQNTKPVLTLTGINGSQTQAGLGATPPKPSSEDFEEPRTGEKPGAKNNGNNGNTTPRTSQEVLKRSFNMMEKCQAIEMCLSLKDEYLAMPLALNHDQGPFWTKVLDEKLERNVAAKIKNWKALKECVDYWCQLRRTLPREGRLPAVSQSQPELDTLVGSWNKVFARRFCQMHKGYFENGDWATTENETKVMAYQTVPPIISESGRA
ncbi:hypothetical protein FOC1_g10002175 [Fusarium oxysporum f. sp. cubense race 1]|uniref:Uncharacterized protein n=1 Tax=Fusarium oxysporum f. sp. cubense (strain race 1) TaxID=1229664 RepID=N4TSV3_FUSC1|nr:hypothetical protein FOC1_g10002175 [Fusarium oxysporum f. sp. cubense race 1]